jgi:WhiB family transcriptional regulator, redox-sensing transcriptional regulator
MSSARPTIGMDWVTYAACQHEDPELFFPITSGMESFRQVRRAMAVCRRCPAQRACRDYAVETGQNAGIWGGTTANERRRIRAGRLQRRTLARLEAENRREEHARSRGRRG